MNLPENGAMGPDCRRRRPCWQKMREGGLAIHGLGRIPRPRRTYDLRFCHDAAHHKRPIGRFATNDGLQSGPLAAFPDTRAQKQRNRNARQPASKQQPASGIQNEAEARACTPDIQNAARSNHARQAIKLRLKRGHARQASKKASGPRRRREEALASQMRHQSTVENTPLRNHE